MATDTLAVPGLAERAGALLSRIENQQATIGIMGLGYVGLPLAMVAIRAGFNVVGFDVNAQRVAQLNDGKSGIKHIPDAEIRSALDGGRFRASNDLDALSEPDAILIAVPTPLSRHREPDLTYVENSTRAIARVLRPGQLVVLESTTWPGTTREVMQPLLEAGGLKAGTDFFLAYSPEREDPGNDKFGTSRIPKVVGADDPASLELVRALYGDTPPPTGSES